MLPPVILTFWVEQISPSTPTMPLSSALPAVEALLGGQVTTKPPTLEYLALQDGSAALVHVVEVQNLRKGVWYEAFIDAHTGDLRSVTDFVARASVSLLGPL